MRPGARSRASRACRGALALALGALVLATGCGSSSKGEPIPSDQANRLLALIQLADSQANDGSCRGAAAKATEAGNVAATLPSSVKKDVRQGLTDGIARLRDLIATQCQKPQTTDTTTSETTTTPSTTTPTTTTPTTTTPTTTTPTTTTPTTTTPTTTTPSTTTPTTTTGNGGTPPPPGNGNGNGQ